MRSQHDSKRKDYSVPVKDTVKLSLCSNVLGTNTMKAHGKVDVQIQIVLILALAGGEWSGSWPCHFTPVKEALVPIG
jgi:hypothetical protein